LCVRFLINIRVGHEASASEFELANEKSERHKSLGIDLILAELIKAGSRTILSQITSLIDSIWNKEELLEEWKDSIIATISLKGDKTESNNYRGISLLLIPYKRLSNILPSRLIPNTDDLIGY
jgi:hypothetical protein